MLLALSEQMQVLHHDADVMVVNKPSGLAVHRGWDREPVNAMTLARELAGRYVYPVHRLDRGTSGCLVFALDRERIPALQTALAGGSKRYVALVRGITPLHGHIHHPVPDDRKRRLDAVTDFFRLDTFERYSLVCALPRTGRLHQIRRHFKHLSHPLIGDVRYGKGEHNRSFRERFGLHRLALHAVRIRFEHPKTGTLLDAVAPLPPDLADPLSAMGFSPDALVERAAHSPGVNEEHA
jgi:tRNA pseudouridine65 synthase